MALAEEGLPRARCVVIIEACEESGSYDLPHYIDHLESRIGQPSLVICLDSGCGNYEQLWSTTNLRGMVAGDLTVEVLSEGVHSGQSSGIVPSSFRVLRQLLDRIEDPLTGRILVEELHAPIPVERVEQVDMVSYFNAGTQWATASGNPEGVAADSACGKRIAVQKATVQVDDITAANKACIDSGQDAITIDQYQLQSDATNAVVTGKDDAMLADSPVIAYAVQQTGGSLETLGEIYDSAPYGVALPKDHEDRAAAFQHAPKDSLPVLEGEGKEVRLILGNAYGERAPVGTASEMFYADAVLAPGAAIPMPDEHEDRGHRVHDERRTPPERRLPIRGRSPIHPWRHPADRIRGRWRR